MLSRSVLDNVARGALRVSIASTSRRAASLSAASWKQTTDAQSLIQRNKALRTPWPTPANARALSGQQQQKAADGAQQAKPEGSATDEIQETPKTAEIVELEAKILELETQLKQKAEANAKLVEENKELKNRALTALADVENMRVRMNNKAEEDRKFAVRGFAKSMLEVADCLEKALASMPEAKRKENEELQQVFEGVEMTDRIFQKGLAAAGIKQFNPLKEKFDPNMHQALFEMPAGEGMEKGTVGAVVKVGYTIHDRVLRPAEVGVNK